MEYEVIKLLDDIVARINSLAERMQRLEIIVANELNSENKPKTK